MTNDVRNQALHASELLQHIQNELGRKNDVRGRIRFPRRFIRTASELRRELPHFGKEVQRRNVSYALIMTDVLRWLAIRTDLKGAALSMIVKEGICILGAICEWMTKEGTRGHASSRPYCQRTKKLVELNLIDDNLKEELDWIWDVRCNEHLHEVRHLEHEVYIEPTTIVPCVLTVDLETNSSSKLTVKHNKSMQRRR